MISPTTAPTSVLPPSCFSRRHRKDIQVVRQLGLGDFPLLAAVAGDALDQASFCGKIMPADTFVQLVGVPHPGPAKAKLFRTIDLASVRASVAAASEAAIDHFRDESFQLLFHDKLLQMNAT
jgi:hypothetical protein